MGFSSSDNFERLQKFLLWTEHCEEENESAVLAVKCDRSYSNSVTVKTLM